MATASDGHRTTSTSTLPNGGNNSSVAAPAAGTPVVAEFAAHLDLPISSSHLMSTEQSRAHHVGLLSQTLATPNANAAPVIPLASTSEIGHQLHKPAADEMSALDQQAHARTHHLLKHQLPDGDMSIHFGTDDLKNIVKIINKMGQRDLQAKFRDVFQTPTFSNNNNWLRRKLMEAVGLQAPKVQGKAKGGGKRGAAPKKKSSKTSDGGTASPPRTPKRKRTTDAHAAVESPASKRRSARRAYLIEENQLIWAKMKGQGYWPAQVVNPATSFITEEQPSPDFILVRYLENSYGWVPQAEVLDLMQNWDRLSTSRSSPSFLAALSRAQSMLKMKHNLSGGTEPYSQATVLPTLVTKMHVDPAPNHEGTESDTATASRHSPLLPAVPDPMDDLLTPNNLSHLCESELMHQTNFGLDGIWGSTEHHSLTDAFLNSDPGLPGCTQDIFVSGLPLISPFL